MSGRDGTSCEKEGSDRGVRCLGPASGVGLVDAEAEEYIGGNPEYQLMDNDRD